MTQVSRLFIVSLLIFVAGDLGFAGEVTMDSGTVIKGEIVEVTESDIVIDTTEMGRMTLKRRSVKSMSVGDKPAALPAGDIAPGIVPAVQPAPAANPPVNININNNQNNNQDNDQKVDQQVTQKGGESTPDQASLEPKPTAERVWKQGLFTRLRPLGSLTLTPTVNGSPPTAGALANMSEKGSSFDGDYIGYRSASNWSVAATGVSSDLTDFGSLSRRWTQVGLKLDWNFGRNAYSDGTLSQWLVGFMVLSGGMTLANKATEVELAEIKGQGGGFHIGYEYLFNAHVGFNLALSSTTFTLDTIEYRSPLADKALEFDVKDQIEVNSVAAFVGLILNWDF